MASSMGENSFIQSDLNLAQLENPIDPTEMTAVRPDIRGT